MPKQGQTTKHKARPPRLCWVSAGVTLAALLALWWVVASTRLAPTLYLVMALAGAVLVADIVFLLTRDASRRGRTIVGCVLAALAVVGSLVGGFYIWRTVNAVRTVSNTVEDHARVSFYAMQDSSAETLDDLADGAFGILKELDRANTDATLQQVETEHGLTLSVTEYDSLIYLADALQNGEVDAIVLNEAYLALYEETPGYEDFPAGLKSISTRQVEQAAQPAETEAQPQEDAVINILISGSDTRESSIDQYGRSDVNIIASINPETHRVLLLSTPRDYFVPLAVGVDNAYDKLTHAGIYGMDVLTGTLENLYGIDIDYYFRINFTGFVEVVDALGGIEVDSDYDFYTEYNGQSYHFTQGTNTLSGEEALAFARTRYAFAEGDRQRGNNQLAIVKAVIRKAMSPAILTSYLSILESVQNYVDTNVPYTVMADLVRQQLEDNLAWTVTSYSVDGSDATSTTYSMNQQLYVMIPDETTVQEAKNKLADLGNTVAQDSEATAEPEATAAPEEPAA